MLIFSFLASGTGLYAQSQIVPSSVASFFKKIDKSWQGVPPVLKPVGYIAALVLISLVERFYSAYLKYDEDLKSIETSQMTTVSK